MEKTNESFIKPVSEIDKVGVFHLNEEGVENAVIAGKMFPLEVFGVDGDGLDVLAPVLHKGEEGTFSFVDSFFPLVFLEDFFKLKDVFFVLFLALNELVEVVFPVKKQLVGVFLLAGGEQDFGVAPVVEIELSASPFLNLGIVGPGDSLEHVFPELGHPEIGQRTKHLRELLFAFVSLEVQREQRQVHQFVEQLLVLEGDIDLFVLEGMRRNVLAGRVPLVVEPQMRQRQLSPLNQSI